MPLSPGVSGAGDPTFRALNVSVQQIRAISRAAGLSAEKLNSGERIVRPGEDPLGFTASARIRSDVGALEIVTETAQLQASTAGLAANGLSQIKDQLDRIKRSLVQAQSANDAQRSLIQNEIDIAIHQIDSTVTTTRLGSRSLLNGDTTIFAAQSISPDGEVTNFDAALGGLGTNSGIYSVKVNKIGVGATGNTRSLNDGRRILSLNVSIAATDVGERAKLLIFGGASGEYSEFRITGKFGSTTVRLEGVVPSRSATSHNFAATIREFNRQAAQTGVVLIQESVNNGVAFASTGYGDDFFIKAEAIGGTTNGAFVLGQALTFVNGVSVGSTAYWQGESATATVNGQRIRLGGEFGTTARILDSGFDLDINFGTAGLSPVGNGPNSITGTVNIDLSTGIKGVLGISGRVREIVQYGYNDFSSGTLGKAAAPIAAVTDINGSAGYGGGSVIGQQLFGAYSVGDIGAGGPLSLDSGNLLGALDTIERASTQVIREQARLGILQSGFQAAVSAAESHLTELSASDADIIGVDAATEVTKLIRAQLGVSVASSALSQTNAIRSNILNLLRG